MRLSTQLAYADQDPARLVGRLLDLERAGLDVVWVPEVYGFDAVSLMGYIAAHTSRVEIGSGILPTYTRTPTLLAMTAAGIDSVSGGRCILGLGASGPQVVEGFHGVPYDRPLGRTREVIDICRQVWRREQVDHIGVSYTIPLPEGQGTGLGTPLKLINRPVRPRIPIYVAALGAKNVAMAAETADGWLPFLYVPEHAGRVWGPSLAAGAARRDGSLGALEVVAGGLLAIGDDAARYRERARQMVALYVGGMGAKGRNFYHDLVCRYGFEDDARAIQDLYLAGDTAAAAERVPTALLEGISLCGPAGYVKERIAAYRESGVTMLNVNPVGGDPVGMVEQVRAWVEEA